MSSLQKFHRRTNRGVPPTWPPMAIGEGDNLHGYWLGTAGDGSSKLIAAPKSAAYDRVNFSYACGSFGTTRGTKSLTDGLANTNTLASFGSSAHPIAYFCKVTSTGGYNTWYLPAIDELSTIVSNSSATPFSITNFLETGSYWSSSESTPTEAWYILVLSGTRWGNYGEKSRTNFYARPVRRY